jgi:hypothetical protein
MAVAESTFLNSDFPAEMVAAVSVDAARDADRVCAFLTELRLSGTADKPLRMPAAFMLHLGAALRLLSWEAQGIFVHREAGLPDAWQAIRDAVHSLQDREADPTPLCVAILRLSVDRFAWHGLRDLGGDVTVDDLTDDAALDSLAEFLWATRRDGAVTDCPQS